MDDKTRITAGLLHLLIQTDYGKNLGNMMFIEEQKAVTQFYRDGSIMRVNTDGDGLDLLCDVLNGMRTRRDAEKDGNQLSDSMPAC